jgi:hypothetical protein
VESSAAHFVCYFRQSFGCIAGVEYLGESIADYIGLNDSRYQWVIDEYQRRKDLVSCNVFVCSDPA